MKRYYYIIFTLILSSYVFSQDMFIPQTDFETVHYIEKLANEGKIDIPFKGFRPYRLKYINKQLDKIQNPTATDKKFIERFREKYIQLDKRFFSFHEGKSRGYIDPYLYQTYTHQRETNGDDELNANSSLAGFRATFHYSDWLTLYSDTSVKFIHEGIELRDEFENPLVFTHDMNSFNSEDYTETYVLISNDELDFSIGKYPVGLGTARLNPLTLKPLRAYYDVMTFNWTAGDFRFGTISGFIHPDAETRFERADSVLTNGVWEVHRPKREKYLAAHRVEWRVADNFNLGINETLIYGDRSIELGYFIPIMPLKWMEHYYGDKDNSTMSFDFWYQPIKNFSTYGELFIDDETWSKGLTKYYGNKWAYTLGFFNTQFLTLNDLTFRFEYSRIEPYVYTHKFHINRYNNSDYYLGSEYGPDSESFFFELMYYLNYDLSAKVNYRIASVGEPIEGKEDEPDYDNDVKHFLHGNVEKHKYYSIDLKYRYNRNLLFTAFYSHTDILNHEHIEGNVYSNNTVSVGVDVTFDNWAKGLIY